MVNINYGENSKEVELTGKTIAEAREIFGSEFGLPDRTRVKINGKWLKKGRESEMVLSDGDVLQFARKSMKPFAILGSFLLTLVLTGAVFAYTQTTDTSTITVGGGSTDFCSVTANATGTASIDYDLLGKHRGVISSGILFDVVPDSSYTGDLVLNVYLNNVDLLQDDYSSWMMRVQLTDNVTNPLVSATEIISLDTPGATFEIEYTDWNGVGDGKVYIYCDGGSYKTFGSGWLGAADPSLYAQVVQAGDH